MIKFILGIAIKSESHCLVCEHNDQVMAVAIIVPPYRMHPDVEMVDASSFISIMWEIGISTFLPSCCDKKQNDFIGRINSIEKVEEMHKLTMPKEHI